MFCIYTEVMELLLNKTTPHFQLLLMSKVDKSQLRIHKVPPLNCPKSHINPLAGSYIHEITK